MSTFYLELSDVLKPVDSYVGELKSIKELFEQRIEKYGLTQAQVEKMLGMQNRTLEGILNQSAIRVDAINILKLCQFLGIRENDFYNRYVEDLPT